MTPLERIKIIREIIPGLGLREARAIAVSGDQWEVIAHRIARLVDQAEKRGFANGMSHARELVRSLPSGVDA